MLGKVGAVLDACTVAGEGIRIISPEADLSGIHSSRVHSGLLCALVVVVGHGECMHAAHCVARCDLPR
jgi:hypothetical protein